MKTKTGIALFLCAVLGQRGTVLAQTADSIAVRAVMYFHEAEQAAAKQTTWPRKLYGPMLFVDDSTHTAWANMPDTGGILKRDGEIYKGTLPKSMIIANTSINWGGKRWSMIRWPLPADKNDRLSLVLHESFHRIQDDFNLPAHSPTADHLSTREGRIYFFLELQALKSALNKPRDKRKGDLVSALLFRKKRQLLFPGSFNNEQLLEANEGLAEYTGVILGRKKEGVIRYLNTVIDSAEKKKSLIRSAPYITGPVYGYLLHDVDTLWTLKVDSNNKFTDLIRNYYRIAAIPGNIDAEVNKRSARYNGARFTASENLKYAEHQELEKQYIDEFAVKPVLVIELKKMNIGFNPGNLFDLGKYGTVYPTMTITDNWGELNVTGGEGALMKDWQVVFLQAKKDIALTAGKTVEGVGWKLNLVAGWKIVQDGLNYKLTKE